MVSANLSVVLYNSLSNHSIFHSANLKHIFTCLKLRIPIVFQNQSYVSYNVTRFLSLKPGRLLKNIVQQKLKIITYRKCRYSYCI